LATRSPRSMRRATARSCAPASSGRRPTSRKKTPSPRRSLPGAVALVALETLLWELAEADVDELAQPSRAVSSRDTAGTALARCGPRDHTGAWAWLSRVTRSRA
jgi:hypothetical protein